MSDTKDRMEELDYEEPMQSSIAEVAEEVKVMNKSCLRVFFCRIFTRNSLYKPIILSHLHYIASKYV